MEIIIKMNHEEPVKVKTSSLYGEMSSVSARGMQILREELNKTKERYQRAEMDLQNRDEEIQDLKLEIDRLQKREELYQKYLNMFDCNEITCVRCIQYRPEDDVPCNLALPQYRHKLINDLNEKLEAL